LYFWVLHQFHCDFSLNSYPDLISHNEIEFGISPSTRL
jgi:hypothetical protein